MGAPAMDFKRAAGSVVGITEDEAVAMRCCQFEGNCVGSKCMAWRWQQSRISAQYKFHRMVRRRRPTATLNVGERPMIILYCNGRVYHWLYPCEIALRGSESLWLVPGTFE